MTRLDETLSGVSQRWDSAPLSKVGRCFFFLGRGGETLFLTRQKLSPQAIIESKERERSDTGKARMTGQGYDTEYDKDKGN